MREESNEWMVLGLDWIEGVLRYFDESDELKLKDLKH